MSSDAPRPPRELAATLLHALRDGDYGDRPAIRSASGTLNHAQLLDLVDQTRRQLIANGTEPGDRVLVVLPDCAEHIVALLAVTAAGGVAVPLAPEVSAVRREYVWKDAAAKLCVLGAETPGPRDAPTLRIEIDEATGRARFEPQHRANSSRSDRAAPRVAPHPAVIRYSSGSTGHPKGVVIGHPATVWTAETLASVYALDQDHRELIVTPLAHSDAWQRVAATLVRGGSVLFYAGPLSVPGILEDLAVHAITGFFMPPPLVRMMLKARAEKVRAALAGCRSIEIGSAPLASDELEEWLERARGASVFVHYGLTECSRAVILDTRRRPDKLDSVGCPAPGVELAVRDSSGRSLEAGETGQIHLRGPQLADGYWNLPDQNALRFRDGWLATGDEGRVDADGYLTFLGRKDDLITSGGYSFFPAEVETELGSVADVAQYLIAGIEDPRRILGQVPCAFVVPSDPDSWSPGDFLKLARERLPAHMVPRGIVPVPHLVLTSSGKPDRRRTVAEFAPSEDAES